MGCHAFKVAMNVSYVPTTTATAADNLEHVIDDAVNASSAVTAYDCGHAADQAIFSEERDAGNCAAISAGIAIPTMTVGAAGHVVDLKTGSDLCHPQTRQRPARPTGPGAVGATITTGSHVDEQVVGKNTGVEVAQWHHAMHLDALEVAPIAAIHGAITTTPGVKPYHEFVRFDLAIAQRDFCGNGKEL